MYKFLRALAIAVMVLIIFTGCKTKAIETPTTKSVKERRVHVLLASGVQPDVLLEPFTDYSFKIIGPASRSQNKHAYSYNAAVVTVKKLETELKNHTDVLEVEVMK